jgi:6-phosphogluconolactonase
VDHDLEVFPDPAAVAARAADYVAGLARAAVAGGGRFTFAVSGGQTPWAMFRALAAEDMPWASAG